jgi:acetylglutamate kinase
MRTVIKLAGALLEDDAVVRSISRQIAEIAKEGHEILVVHGGGKIFTATLKRLGIESKFDAGLRVTDRETRDVAVMVFAGLLNKKLSSAISLEGVPAIGISAADAKLFLAEPMSRNAEEGELGFVGYLTGVNAAVLESLWREKLLPVAACLGLGPDNELYNINADHMAAACAEYIGAERLIYLTDVPGVLDGDKVVSSIACEEIESMVQARVVSGGMVLKLEAAKRAIEGGVSEVKIVGGSSADSLLKSWRAADSAGEEVPGTRVVRERNSAPQAAVTVA